MTKALACFDDLGFLFQMGCGGSKVDDLALVVRCRERKQLIRAAADHRYALAAAHISYFKSLEGVGDALRQFVQEELVIVSPPPSPVLTLPSDEGKPKKRHVNSSGSGNHKSTSSPTSLSHTDSGSTSHLHSLGNHDHDHNHDRDQDDSSDSDSELSSPAGQYHHHPPEESMPPFTEAFPQTAWGPYGMNSLPSGYPPFGMNPNPNPSSSWSPFGMNPYPTSESGWDPYGYGMNSISQAYHMKKSAPAVQTVIYDPDNAQESGQVPESSSYIYSTSYMSNPYQNSGGYFGFPMGVPPPGPYENKQPSHPPPEPPPPPSPQVSSWDYFNPFNMFDNNGYAGYYSQNIKLEFGSIASSPDTNEVREREGIPELEDETEPEAIKEEVLKAKKVYEGVRRSSGEGTSRSVKSRKKSGESSSKIFSSKKKHSSEDSPRRATFHKENSEEGNNKQSTSNNGKGSTNGFPSQTSEEISVEPTSLYSEKTQSASLKEGKSSLETTLSERSEDVSAKRKSVTFEVGSDGTQDVESSNFSSLTTIYAHGTKDLNDVVEEIEKEFKTASTYGKEVASMLEVSKLPYQPRFSLLKVVLSRIMYLIAPTVSYSTPPSRRSLTLDFNTTQLAKSYLADSGNMKTLNFSSTLDKLYAWEKKLYKEVKDEERLRLIYEKQCRRLKLLDERGAESSKIDATHASIRKLLMKLDVCIKAVDSISRRIHKLRDEELQPQVTELVRGLIRMWRDMLKCHQNQFQAIMESKIRRLRAANTIRRESSLKATIELEFELRTWCNNFRDWMNNQRSFIESLNGWLIKCLHYEPEQSPDGIVPFSPGRVGAPPVFIVCNDWFQAMETISEKGVKDAVDKFASILRQLWENQEEENRQQQQELKAYISSKDLEKRVKSLGSDSGSGKTGGSSMVDLDDLKVDLDLMRKRLQEERASQKKNGSCFMSDSNSLQASLIPIFEALGNFTSQALKAYENVRTPNSVLN